MNPPDPTAPSGDDAESARAAGAAEHRSLREQLGAFALDQLPPEERTALQAHLDGCPACRDELATIAPLAATLTRIDPDTLAEHESAVSPPPWLGDAVVAGIRTESQQRRRNRWPRRHRLGTAVAASILAAALLTAGVGIGSTLAPEDSDGPLEPVALAREAPGVDAEAGVVPHTWGMEVRVVGTGFAPGRTYRATVFDATARPVAAGSFVGTGANELECRLNSAVLRSDARGFVITDTTGQRVLAADLDPAR